MFESVFGSGRMLLHSAICRHSCMQYLSSHRTTSYTSLRNITNKTALLTSKWTRKQATSPENKSGTTSRAQQQVQSQNENWMTSIRTGVLVGVTVSVIIASFIYRNVKYVKNAFTVFSSQPNTSDLSDPETRADVSKEALLLPWLQSHSKDLLTLLNLCQSDDRDVRMLGVSGLALVDNWPDWQYHLASMLIDTKTLVGLARTEGANPKLFPKQPRMVHSKCNILSGLRRLLSALPVNDVDKATQNLTSLALSGKENYYKLEKSPMWTFDGNDFLQLEPITTEKDQQGQELLILLALEAHSQSPSHSLQIVNEGGLDLMRWLYELHHGDVEVVGQIAHLLANLTQHEIVHQQITESGWVTLLFEWLNSDNLMLSVYATKALANLDQDFTGPLMYPDSVLLYYPQFRSRHPIYADVVFIHGLLGGPFRTWRQNDRMRPKKQPVNDKSSHEEGTATPYTMCWPRDWLAGDCPNLRILTVEYETRVTDWSTKSPDSTEKQTLLTRGKDLLIKLQASGLGCRPIVWVAHSMGGLLIKQMLELATDDASLSEIVRQTKGLVFYSVPHKGSPLALYLSRTKYLLQPSTEVQLLHQGSKELLALHEKFECLVQSANIPMLSFGEGSKTNLPLSLRATFVPRESSNPGFGRFHLMKDQNHLDICKPTSKNSLSYQLTLKFIRQCIPELQIE